MGLALPTTPFPNMSASQHHRPRIRMSSLWLAACFACLASSVASKVPESELLNHIQDVTAPPSMPTHQPRDSSFLMTDTRTPVMENGQWTMLAHDEVELRLRKRQDEEGSTTVFTISVGDSTTVSPTATESAQPLPSPFDSSLAFNFTSNDGSSCPTYINEMLTSPTFQSCYPLSLLIQVSTLPTQYVRPC